jgi:long-chain fatty acid transport protein
MSLERRVRAWLVGLGMLLCAASSAANPLDIYGFGARARSLGGTGTAIADDVSAAWYNPAGLVSAEGIIGEMGWFRADPNLEIDGRDVGVETTEGLEFGFVLPGKLLGARVAFGGAFHVPDARVVRFLVQSRDRVQFALYSNASQRIAVLLPVAVRITDWLDVGVGANVIGDNAGGVDFVIRQEGQGVSEGSLEAAQLAVAAPVAGLQLRPFEHVALGLAYRGEISIQLDTPVVIHFDPLVIPPNPIPIIEASILDVSALTVTHFQPQQAAFALACRPLDSVLTTAQLTWRGWSSYVPPIPKTKTVLTGGLADLLPTLPEFPVPDPNFHDTFEPAVGLAWQAFRSGFVDAELRAGYFYRPSPVPNQSGSTNLVDNPVHGVSGGVGLSIHVLEDVLRAPPRIDLSGQAHLLADRTTHKADLADPIGNYRSGGDVVAMGITASVVY